VGDTAYASSSVGNPRAPELRKISGEGGKATMQSLSIGVTETKGRWPRERGPLKAKKGGEDSDNLQI